MQYKIEKIGIQVLAFLVARCQLFGMYPFVVPFFMGAYLEERSSITMFFVLLVSVFIKGGAVIAFKYGLVLLVLLMLLSNTNREEIFSDGIQIAFAVGMILWGVGMPYDFIVTGDKMSLLNSLIEGIIAGCSVLIFEQGFSGLRAGSNRMFATNQRFVGIFAIWSVALFGCPAWREPVNLLFILGTYLLVYNLCRFDSGVGIATGSMVGLLLSFQQDNVSWLAVMILLSGIMVILRELGKGGIMLGFLAGYILLGLWYDFELLNLSMLRSVGIVLVLFLFTPKFMLRRSLTKEKEGDAPAQERLIAEVTKSKVEEFGHAFLAMEEILMEHEKGMRLSVPNGLSNMYLSGDGISLLNAVESQSNRLLELRRNFIGQLGQIGSVISAFSTDLTQTSKKTNVQKQRLSEVLSRKGVVVTNMAQVKDHGGRMVVYMCCYQEGDGLITGRELAGYVERVLQRPMVCIHRSDEVVAQRESRFSFVEKGVFFLTTGVVRKKRKGESLCGDNFSVTKMDNQEAVVMLCDGMGSGEDAYEKSAQMVDLLEQLLQAGFSRELAVEMLNSCVSFLSDGSVSTSLDLTVINLYTGMADFMKLGASTTFVRRKGEVECIHSTSLPVGVLEQIEFDTCTRRLYDGDMIVIVSDGVMDGILAEDQEAYLVSRIQEMDTRNAQLLAEELFSDIREMQMGNLRDDSTILVIGVWKQ